MQLLKKLDIFLRFFFITQASFNDYWKGIEFDSRLEKKWPRCLRKIAGRWRLWFFRPHLLCHNFLPVQINATIIIIIIIIITIIIKGLLFL